MNLIKEYQKINIFVAKPSEGTKILEFKQYQKSDKAPFIIYAVVGYLIEETNGCKTNPENLSETKVGKRISSGFLM